MITMKQKIQIEKKIDRNLDKAIDSLTYLYEFLSDEMLTRYEKERTIDIDEVISMLEDMKSER